MAERKYKAISCDPESSWLTISKPNGHPGSVHGLENVGTAPVFIQAFGSTGLPIEGTLAEIAASESLEEYGYNHEVWTVGMRCINGDPDGACELAAGV